MVRPACKHDAERRSVLLFPVLRHMMGHAGTKPKRCCVGERSTRSVVCMLHGARKPSFFLAFVFGHDTGRCEHENVRTRVKTYSCEHTPMIYCRSASPSVVCDPSWPSRRVATASVVCDPALGASRLHRSCAALSTLTNALTGLYALSTGERVGLRHDGVTAARFATERFCRRWPDCPLLCFWLQSASIKNGWSWRDWCGAV
jgi:hypothetical protein